jgi:hypothetical protein
MLSNKKVAIVGQDQLRPELVVCKKELINFEPNRGVDHFNTLRLPFVICAQR